jgi:hypothetical protein
MTYPLQKGTKEREGIREKNREHWRRQREKQKALAEPATEDALQARPEAQPKFATIECRWCEAGIPPRRFTKDEWVEYEDHARSHTGVSEEDMAS